MDDNLLRAYRETDYHVHAAPPLVLRIGEACDGLAPLLDRHGVATAAFLTAWNPFSRPTPGAENDAAQARLAAWIAWAGFARLDGEGRGRDGDWPAEPGFLILGIPRQAAEGLSRTFGQNAFVWAEAHRAPELVLTPP